MRSVHGIPVRGVGVDAETRCRHYASDRDVVAIRFACCEHYYPCFECHETVAGHEATRWGRDAGDREAILCGACGHQLRISAYVDGNDRCPVCDAAFNPGCRTHYHRYFDERLFEQDDRESVDESVS